MTDPGWKANRRAQAAVALRERQILAAQIRLSPEARADVLGRGLACGIAAALREAPPEHAVLRLRALAAWLTRAADRIEGPIPVATPEDVPRALAAVAERRVGS